MINPSKSLAFGIEGYVIDKKEFVPGNIQTKKWQDDKIPTMWDSIKKHSESIPSPDKYTGQTKTGKDGKFFCPKSKR